MPLNEAFQHLRRADGPARAPPHGFSREALTIRWSFERREDLAAVLSIEFPAELAASFLTEVAGCEVDYAVNLWWRNY